jgi:hypothetical protein
MRNFGDRDMSTAGFKHGADRPILKRRVEFGLPSQIITNRWEWARPNKTP